MVDILSLPLVFSRLEQAMRREWYYHLCVEGADSSRLLQDVRQVLEGFDEAEVRDFKLRDIEGTDKQRLELNIKLASVRNQEAIVQKLMRVQGIQRVMWD